MTALSTRRLVAGFAMILTLAGAAVYWRGNEISGGIMVRSGLVLGAVWLAWPLLSTINTRWLVPALAVVGFAVTKPAMLIWIAPVLLVIALLGRRRAK